MFRKGKLIQEKDDSINVQARHINNLVVLCFYLLANTTLELNLTCSIRCNDFRIQTSTGILCWLHIIFLNIAIIIIILVSFFNPLYLSNRLNCSWNSDTLARLGKLAELLATF